MLFFTIFAMGGVVISGQRTVPKQINKGASVLLSINEIVNPNKEWRKSICTVNSILTEKSTIKHDEKVVLFFNTSQVRAGDVLLVQVDVESIENRNNPGEFNVKDYWNNKDIYQMGFVGESDFKLIRTNEPPWWQRWPANIRSYLTRQLRLVLDEESLGVGVALLLGDKQLLSNEVRSSFSNAGAMHVLAVSGLHVGIILFILTYVLGRFTRFISKTNAILSSIVIIWIYAGVTGFSPSVMRASFMFSILAIAQIAGRNKNPMNLLFFSAFSLLVFQPLWIYDIGFQLSYLAMIGIFLLYDSIAKLAYFKSKWLTKIWQGTAVGISAQVFTVPLTLYYFHQFPNYFMVTNVGMMVFAGMILGIGLFFFSIGWSSILTFLVGNILKISLVAMIYFVQFIDHLPFSVATGFELSIFGLCLIYLGLILFVTVKLKPFKRGLVFLFMAIFIQTQYHRYLNYTVKEMVIFNSDDFSMVLKSRGQIICFHRAKKERVERVERVLRDYNLVKPGEVEMVYLKDGLTKLKIGGERFEISTDKYGVDISSEKVELYVRTNYSGNFVEFDKVFDMAYLAKSQDRYNLTDGARTISLN